MPKNKVLCLKDKVKICEDSQKPGFSKEKCIIDYDIKRNTLNKLLQNKENFSKFNDSQSLNSKQKNCSKGKNFEMEVELKLSEWIKIRNSKGYPVSGEDIKTRALC